MALKVPKAGLTTMLKDGYKVHILYKLYFQADVNPFQDQRW
jgi:hypothetical protein